jgi:cellobiose phosphorylase
MSYVGNPLHGRITRYRINDVPFDRPGKYIYVRDEETGDFWSLTWQPVGRDKNAYRTVHGFGYTRSDADLFGIVSSVLFFVPKDKNLEVWKAVMHNTSSRRRRLSVFAYVEFCLGHALIDLINQCDDQHFNRVYFDEAQNTLFATKTYWVTETRGTQHQENKAWDRWAFLTASRPVKTYETVRERFIGPYRTESYPIGVETNRLSSEDMDCGNAVGVLQTVLDVAPGETGDVVFNLGVVPKNKMSAPRLNTVCLFEPGVTRELGHVRKGWDDVLSAVRVDTPDDRMNVFLNGWTPYQARVAFDVGRLASFYYWGIGRGFGFRDTAQDILAVLASDPEKAVDRIRLLSRQMFCDGRVYHHFLGNGQGEITGHCDDPLWYILAVTEYVKETGDKAILDVTESFLDMPEKGAMKEGTILDHCRAVVRFAGTNLGLHGLPGFGRGDWNDTLDYIGGEEGGESVWGGFFYAAMLERLAGLLRYIGDEDFRKEVEDLKEGIASSLDRFAWDGEWYIRALGAGKRKIGSKKNKAGRIFLNPQSWAVISGATDSDRQIQAMDSVWKHLDTNFGPKICAPAFKEIDPEIGLVTRCVHGKKENAAVFLHPTAWAIQAECLLGRADRAYSVYKKLLPDAVPSDTFRAEPYVYSQYITSDEHPEAGRASHSWQTGTAAWMYRVMIDYFLGVRPEYEGLRVDPVIPSEWKEFSIERVFRGTRYRISVTNPEGVQCGVRSVVCDGKERESSLLPLSNNPVCDVRVVMGKPPKKDIPI